jgi:hypothetical protein
VKRNDLAHKLAKGLRLLAIAAILVLALSASTLGTPPAQGMAGSDLLDSIAELTGEGVAASPGPEMNVYGKGVSITDGDDSPSTADDTDFGEKAVTGESQTREFTIENAGDSDLNLGSPRVDLTGGNPGDFTVNRQPISPIPEGRSVTFEVTFDPTDAGLRWTWVYIENNDSDENPYNFKIQGTGISSEGIDMGVIGNNTTIPDGDTTPCTEDHTDFGETTVGGNIVRTFTIKNYGSENLNLTGSPDRVALSGDHAGDFTVDPQPDTPVPGGGTKTFDVTFAPSAQGLREATLTIANNDPDENPYDFSIQGTGSAPIMNVKGNGQSISNEDTTPSTTDDTDFGAANVNGGTVEHTFTIENNGSINLDLSGSPRVAKSGTHAADFTVNPYPSTPVYPLGDVHGNTTTFKVTFNPSAEGLRSATLSIANNDDDQNPYTFNIQGTGGYPEIDVQRPASTSIADGSTDNVGGRDPGAVNLTYTIDNTAGTSPVTIPAGGVTADNLSNCSNFSVVTTLPLNVAEGGTAALSISFDVDGYGAFSFDMDIDNNDGDENPYDIQVSGTGGYPEIDVQRPASTSIADGGTDSIGDKNVGAVNLTYTIDNTAGIAPVIIPGGGVTADNLSNCSNFSVGTALPLNVAAGNTATLDISFDVNVNGAFSFDMDIDNNDGDENPYDIQVSGTGTGGVPEIDVQRPASTSIADGGTDNVGGRDPGAVNLTYTIDNTAGTAQLTIPGGGVTADNLSNCSNFSVGTALPLNVAAGNTATLDISFDVDASGAFSFDMDIDNDDGDEDPYDIQVSGTGIAPEIDVQRPASTSIADGGTDSIGDKNVGAVNLTYTIDNTAGTAQLTIPGGGVTADNLSNCSNFSVGTTLPLNVPAGNTATLDISFDVNVNGAFSFDMDIDNNDENENPYDIQVSGTGTGGVPEIDVQRPASTSIADGGTDNVGGRDPGAVNLDDGQSQTFNNVAAGSYTVTETDPTVTPGSYTLTNLNCVESGTHNSFGTAGTRTATIELEAGETVTCTFTNTLPNVETATGSGTATFESDKGIIQDLAAVDEGTLPPEGKPDLDFPHGFFSFNITGLTPCQHETVVVTITLPSAVPVGTQYWKYHASEGGWIQIPMGSDDGDNVITITLQDGGLGDDDGECNGEIVDPGGPGQLPPKTLTVNKTGTGAGTVTSAPAGIFCGADCTEDYLKNTVVTLRAYPGVKSYFVGWSGNCDANGQVTMDADKTCTATFGYPVGGIVVPVDKLGLLVPWLGLASLAALTVALVRKRRG